ncbi:MAG: nucleoside/nucleotide kinase family protein [Candidatus Obscuribacterales bacterium]|nr:nucleoside/nucleotide kinase family protein [Candidatus Obscuribacterales bacterium]
MEELFTELLETIDALPPGKRFVLGIVGCPGAGKSTLAQALVESINLHSKAEIAVVVPMDGYHLSNETLTERGLLALKGIPDTFDAEGFIQLLAKLSLNEQTNVYAPKFERSTESSIVDAIVIKPEHKLCVVEGNYLLLSTRPWSEARRYLDSVWFVDVELSVLKERLQQRHESAGRTPADAEKKVFSTDLPNAEIVYANRGLADKIVRNQDMSRTS